MGLFDVSEEKKRAKEIRKEGKFLRKELLTSGLDKKWVDSFLEEFFSCLERAYAERLAYESARRHTESCLQIINDMLPQMREISPAECKTKLQSLLVDLPLVYHDCFVRKDDLDYEITLSYMKRQVPAYEQKDRLMMQSELENLKSVFDDASLWHAPNYMALAYFLLHEGSAGLADMENTQRNLYIERVYKERFWSEGQKTLEQGNVLAPVREFEKKMLA